MNELLLIIAFIIGFLTKYVDLIEDEKLKSFRLANVILGFMYGTLLTFVVINWPIISSLVIGTVLGLVIAKKIDAPGHFVGIGVFAILLILFYSIQGFAFNSLFVYLLVLFTIVNVVEELLNDVVDKNLFEVMWLKRFLKLRPILEIMTFIISFILNMWLLWLTILFYDLAYNITNKLLSKS